MRSLVVRYRSIAGKRVDLEHAPAIIRPKCLRKPRYNCNAMPRGSKMYQPTSHRLRAPAAGEMWRMRIRDDLLPTTERLQTR